jgi:ABC-type transporter Mla subunit MlaD
MIENLPASQTRLGSILLETATLKKQLAEMPRSITESIRHNVAETMETETKLLKDELNNASEVLDAVPTKLEQYVE